MSDRFGTAVVTGASRGFGRAIAAALVASGAEVVGIARDERALRAARDELGEGFIPLAGDATDEALAQQVIRERVTRTGRQDALPALLVLNAGARPPMAPVHHQTWEEFSANWHADTRHVFTWAGAALREPLPPGSVVIAVSSGAALRGSSLSGGYAGAKAAVRHISAYAADESERAGLGIRFVSLVPMRMSPEGGVGMAGIDGYSARQGVGRDTFIEGLQPILTADQVGKAVLEIVADPDGPPEYHVTDAGVNPAGQG